VIDQALLKEVVALLEDIKPYLKKFIALHITKILAPAYKPGVYVNLIRLQALLESEIDRLNLEPEECDD